MQDVKKQLTICIVLKHRHDLERITSQSANVGQYLVSQQRVFKIVAYQLQAPLAFSSEILQQQLDVHTPFGDHGVYTKSFFEVGVQKVS